MCYQRDKPVLFGTKCHGNEDGLQHDKDGVLFCRYCSIVYQYV